MNKSIIIAAVCIMLGLVLGGVMIPRAAKVNRSFDRTVSVKGLCEREVKADKAIWPIVTKVGGDNLQGVLGEVERNNRIIKAFLLEGGISEDEITSSISISDRNTLDYNNDRSQRFIAKSVTTICTGKVDAVLSLKANVNTLLSQGIAIDDSDWENTTQFSFEALNELKPGMIEEATRNAREVAQKFAEDSDSRLGKIRSASQGTFSIEDRDSNTPQIKKVRVVTSITYYLSR